RLQRRRGPAGGGLRRQAGALPRDRRRSRAHRPLLPRRGALVRLHVPDLPVRLLALGARGRAQPAPPAGPHRRAVGARARARGVAGAAARAQPRRGGRARGGGPVTRIALGTVGLAAVYLLVLASLEPADVVTGLAVGLLIAVAL